MVKCISNSQQHHILKRKKGGSIILDKSDKTTVHYSTILIVKVVTNIFHIMNFLKNIYFRSCLFKKKQIVSNQNKS